YLLPSLVVHVPPVTRWASGAAIMFGCNRVLVPVLLPEWDIRKRAAGVHVVLPHVPKGITVDGVAAATDQITYGDIDVAVAVHEIEIVQGTLAVAAGDPVGVELIERCGDLFRLAGP